MHFFSVPLFFLMLLGMTALFIWSLAHRPNPRADAEEAEERMRQQEDALTTLSGTWAYHCKKHGVRPESIPPNNRELDAVRQDLVYAACGVWRDPLVIDVVAFRLPGLFENWRPTAI